MGGANCFTYSLIRRNCRYMDSGDQIEQRICHRCGNVLPLVASRHDKCDIDAKCLDHVGFSTHHNKQFA